MFTTLILWAVLSIAARKPSATPSPVPPATPPGAGFWRPDDPATWPGYLLAFARVWLAAHAGQLVSAGVLLLAVAVAVYLLRRWLWRRAVAAGTWVEVVPPRVTAIGQSAAAWRLLASLAARAQHGLHLVKPPMAMEVHGDGGRLALTVWVPAWISASAVDSEVRLAWPGATTRRFGLPAAADDGHAAGYRLAPIHTDLGPLVDDTSLGRDARDADPLRPVFDALRQAGGPTVLQVLAKPAGGRRIKALAWAARRPAPPRRPVAVRAVDLFAALLLGAVREVLDFFQSTGTGRAGGTGEAYRPPDALQRAAMRLAADKLATGPHLLVAIRTLAVRPARAYARAEARAVAHGYAVAAKLRPRRLRRALRLVTGRFAPRGHWILATASELGVLLHLPADPARHGFPVAALTRAFPTDTAQIPPERATAHTSGWTGQRWTTPPQPAVTDATDDDPGDPHGPGDHDANPFPTTDGDRHDVH